MSVEYSEQIVLQRVFRHRHRRPTAIHITKLKPRTHKDHARRNRIRITFPHGTKSRSNLYRQLFPPAYGMSSKLTVIAMSFLPFSPSNVLGYATILEICFLPKAYKENIIQGRQPVHTTTRRCSENLFGPRIESN